MTDTANAATLEDLGNLLTIIITTSPSPIMPSTELLYTVLSSLRAHAFELTVCRIIIVCDGVKPSSKSNFRSGKVDAVAAAAYTEYKARLRTLVNSSDFEFRHAEIMELEWQHGFGFAVHAALQHVHTPLVCVVQVVCCCPRSRYFVPSQPIASSYHTILIPYHTIPYLPYHTIPYNQ